MVEEVKDIIEVLRVLKEILPPGGASFVLALLLRADVKNISLESGGLGLALRRAFAGFSPKHKSIAIDLDFPRARYVEAIRRRHGLKVTEEEAVFLLILHELAHAQPTIWEDEGKADEWAYQQFVKFRSQG